MGNRARGNQRRHADHPPCACSAGYGAFGTHPSTSPDRQGCQIAVRDGFGVWRYEVTDAGQRARETTPHGVLERQYDAQGRLAGISVPALDYRVRYAYVGAGGGIGVGPL